MDLKPGTYENVVVLSPEGRIDHSNADGFQTALEPFVKRCTGDSVKLVIEMRGVEYMSSVGLRVLMATAKQVRAQKGEVVISGLQPTMQEIFEIARFHHIFSTYPDVRGALAALSEAALARFDGA